MSQKLAFFPHIYTQSSIYFSQERNQIKTQGPPQKYSYVIKNRSRFFPLLPAFSFIFRPFQWPSGNSAPVNQSQQLSSWQEEEQRHEQDFRISVSSSLVLLLWQQHTFPQLMRLLCGKRKAKEVSMFLLIPQSTTLPEEDSRKNHIS